jgi:hypothetical protein
MRVVSFAAGRQEGEKEEYGGRRPAKGAIGPYDAFRIIPTGISKTRKSHRTRRDVNPAMPRGKHAEAEGKRIIFTFKIRTQRLYPMPV